MKFEFKVLKFVFDGLYFRFEEVLELEGFLDRLSTGDIADALLVDDAGGMGGGRGGALTGDIIDDLALVEYCCDGGLLVLKVWGVGEMTLVR